MRGWVVGVGLSSFVVLDFLTLQSPQRCDVKFVFEDLCFVSVRMLLVHLTAVSPPSL